MSAVFALVFGGLAFIGILGLYEAFFRVSPARISPIRWHIGLGIEGIGAYVAGLSGLLLPTDSGPWTLLVGGGLALVTVGFLLRSSPHDTPAA